MSQTELADFSAETPAAELTDLTMVKYSLVMFLLIVFLSWYLFPLIAIDWYLLVSGGFVKTIEPIGDLAQGLKRDDLGLDEIPKLLVGVVASGGLSLMLLEPRRGLRLSQGFAVLVILVLLIAAFAAVFTYHFLIMYPDRLDQPYGDGTAQIFIDVTVGRFRELWILISALAGFGLVSQRIATRG